MCQTRNYLNCYICIPPSRRDLEYSHNHIPDVGVLYHANDGTHILGGIHKKRTPQESRLTREDSLRTMIHALHCMRSHTGGVWLALRGWHVLQYVSSAAREGGSRVTTAQSLSVQLTRVYLYASRDG